MALHALCLFDGYGGFELGFRLAGLDIRTVCRVERDSHAAATLVARMEEETLDRAPIWDDVTTFDGRPWAGRVDLITAGFNCQPFSSAGQSRGVDDERWLWPDIARIVAEVGPRFVYLENVGGLVRLGGLDRVCGDLADLGFDAEWGLLSAAAVGAPHKRERFWLLAMARCHGDGLGRVIESEAGSGRIATYDLDRCDQDVGHTGSQRRPEVTRGTPSDEDAHGWRQDTADIADSSGEDVADAESARLERERHTRIGCDRHARANAHGQDVADATSVRGDEGARRPTRDGWTLTWPPGPTDSDGWADYINQGGPEPQIRRSTDGRPLGLAESLHLGGNGLVPQVAAHALAQLATRAGIGRQTARGRVT